MADEGDGCILDHQKLMIKQIIRHGLENNKCNRHYKNSKVHNIMSTHHEIKINDPEKEDFRPKQEPAEGARIDYEQIRVDEHVKKNQMTVRDDQ